MKKAAKEKNLGIGTHDSELAIELGKAKGLWKVLDFQLICIEFVVTKHRLVHNHPESIDDQCDEIKELRETLYNKFHEFAYKWENYNPFKLECASEDPGLDEIIN
jgi:hypothetical protein